MNKSGGTALFGEKLGEFLQDRAALAPEILDGLIAVRSVPGTEGEVQGYIHELLGRNGLPSELSPIEETIVDDPDFALVPGSPGYRDRPNVVVKIPGTGGGRSLIVNTHSDVVPGPDDLFTPRVGGGTIFGRGACDAKGQIVTLLLALTALQKLGVRLKGDVEAQFVVEEEAGGNGTLALLAAGSRADAAVVLEPTGLGVRPANRGAAWFRLGVTGQSVHMGRYNEGVSAFEEMLGLVRLLKEYEARLRQESKGYPGFPADPSPVVVNIGRIRGGDWPSTLPADCVVEGGIAFLPNKSVHQVEEEVRDLILNEASSWAREHSRFELTGLRNEPFETPADHPAVKAFLEAAGSVLGPRPPEGWTASCDARLFFHRGKMPVLVFGAGELRHAHALDEQVEIRDILRAAQVLVRFIVDWCGLE